MRENFVAKVVLILLTSNVYLRAACGRLKPPPTLEHDRPENVPQSYLVQLRPGIGSAASALHHEWLSQLTLELAERTKSELVKAPTAQTVLDHGQGFKGVTNIFDLNDDFRAYSIHTDESVVDQIRMHPDVEIVEQEPYIYADPQFLHSAAVSAIDQVGEPWGLGRVSHQGHENTSWPYSYSSEGQGQGVDVYVLDSGIFAEHEEFGGRVITGISCVPEEKTTEDFYGHGTHCAGTIAGTNVGVAKLATLIPVKVLPRTGTTDSSFLINGMKWVYAQHKQRTQQADPNFRGSVVSISVGCPFRKSIDNLTKSLAQIGLHVVVAAGNEHVDSCTQSPGASKFATTVGAVDSSDKFASFSNFGSCVDIQAPGVNITSASHLYKTGYVAADGTSQACPHVAGAIATLLSRLPAQGIDALSAEMLTPERMRADLIHIMTKNVIGQSTLPPNTTGGIVYNGGSRTNYTDIVDRGGWPECCT